MSDHFEVMPDYLAALELELRARAVPAAHAGVRPVWRRPALALAMAVLIIVPVLLSGRIGDDTPAYGTPAILAARPGPIPAFVADGLALKAKAGAGVHLERARPFPAFRETAYLIDGDGVWCVSVPSSKGRDPRMERGVVCTRTREFFRVGIQVVLPPRYVAVIPQGVKDPTVIHADGTRQDLRPNRQGVVTFESVSHRDRFVLYGMDGQRRTSRAR